MPQVAKTTAPACRRAAQDRGSWVAIHHVTAVQPDPPGSVPDSSPPCRANDIRPNACGRPTAARRSARSRTANRRTPTASGFRCRRHLGGRRAVRHLGTPCRGHLRGRRAVRHLRGRRAVRQPQRTSLATCAEAFHVQAPLDGVEVERIGSRRAVAGQLHPAGVAHSAQDRPVVHRDAEQRRCQRRDQSTVGHQHHRMVGLVGTPFGWSATSSATNGTMRRATSTRLSPPCGTPGIFAPRPAGRRACAPTSRWVRPASLPGASRAAAGVDVDLDAGGQAEQTAVS